MAEICTTRPTRKPKIEASSEVRYSRRAGRPEEPDGRTMTRVKDRVGQRRGRAGSLLAIGGGAVLLTHTKQIRLLEQCPTGDGNGVSPRRSLA